MEDHERCTGDKTIGNQKLTEVTKDTKVFDIVDQYPDTLQIFLDFGFSQMANPVMRNTMGRVATIDMATKMHNVDIENSSKPLTTRLLQKSNRRRLIFSNIKIPLYYKPKNPVVSEIDTSQSSVTHPCLS